VCAGLGGGLTLTGDEAGLFAPAFGGMGYMLCPFQFRFDLPMELIAGAGTVIHNAFDEPLFACVPPGTPVQVEGCYIHEPGTDDAGLIGLYTGSTQAKSLRNVPCPDASLPLPADDTGLPIFTGVGPVIGVSGLVSQ
jgi:hypothetical protein